ncbi:harmonin-binding protein USHBP1 [Ctenodactylus gundi]
MSTRATRPRSRRGRHTQPGELDPVAESLEEAEAGSCSSRPSPGLPQQCSRSQPSVPIAEPSGQGPGSRTYQDCEGELSPTLEAAPWDKDAVLPGPGAPDVFQTLQHALSSLEATVASWRPCTSSAPCPTATRDTAEGALGLSRGQEGPGGFPQEAARLTERNAWLRLALGTREDELAHVQASLRVIQAEKDVLQREFQDLQDSLRRAELSLSPPRSPALGLDSDSGISGAEGESRGTQDPSLGHLLLRRLQSDSSIHMLGSLSSQTAVHILEGQVEQLRGSMEKLKCFNRLLLAVLQGHKGRCEVLSMQLGQREAEATALRLALQYSEDCEEAYGALLALQATDVGVRNKGTSSGLQAAEELARRLLALKDTDGGPPPYSPLGSSVNTSTPQEVAAQLRAHIQDLREHRALVKVPPEPGPPLVPRPIVPHAEAMVQSILETQPGPALPQLEKIQIQQDLVATRETLADLVLRLQLVRREKRGLELQEAALRALGPAHTLLLEQLRWEWAQCGAGGTHSSSGDSSGGGSSIQEEDGSQDSPAILGGTSGISRGQVYSTWDSEKLAQELAASVTRARDLQEQLRSLREQLERVALEGRARRLHSTQLSSDLCKAHSSLIQDFQGAHRKQEEQRRKLEQQVALMEVRQAEELAALEAVARAVGEPGPPPTPPRRAGAPL